MLHTSVDSHSLITSRPPLHLVRCDIFVNAVSKALSNSVTNVSKLLSARSSVVI